MREPRAQGAVEDWQRSRKRNRSFKKCVEVAGLMSSTEIASRSASLDAACRSPLLFQCVTVTLCRPHQHSIKVASIGRYIPVKYACIMHVRSAVSHREWRGVSKMHVCLLFDSQFTSLSLIRDRPCYLELVGLGFIMLKWQITSSILSMVRIRLSVRVPNLPYHLKLHLLPCWGAGC